MHPVHRRLLAEELVRLRPADEERRYVASQRAGRIDPNPHQIDAVVFALQRIPEGGCILADEVGLGKTIEAGLVMAQLRAEGAKKLLLVTPKPLLGQWREELYSLFGMTVREVSAASSDAFDGEGIFAVGRELAGTKPVAGRIEKAGPWDLCVIDEAHEHFAGIWKRFDATGVENEDSRHAKTAGNLKGALGASPVLLLTATPIQNSLAELWGLVHYVDPSGTLLGDLPTFRALFAASAREGGDRRLAEGSGPELRRRLAQVVQRTLRRQAQDFLDKPFVGRMARTFEYEMSADERALYDDVTRYLLSPSLQAFRGSHRALLLLGFHRRMASSKAALAASLKNVETRLERMLRGDRVDEGDETARAFESDLEDDELVERLEIEERDEGGEIDRGAVEEELARVRGLRVRAEELTEDGKARALLKAVRIVLERGRHGEGGGKVVIFTESRRTQDYLRELLMHDGLADDDITVFRGQNDHPRAKAALARWEAEVEAGKPARERPSREVATRLALVHEFRTRSRVFLGTEAAAKGLNLQFCDTLVNYDLPWNPQRIEQRIGRVHRYGQKTDVTIINFLAKDNEAQRLTYEILSQKLELFGNVLGASDAVLHAASDGPSDAVLSALGDDFEKRLGAIYRQARSIDEIVARLAELRETTTERRRAFEDEQARTRELIESRLDARVREVFANIQGRLAASLAAFDRDVEALVGAYLDAHEVPFTREAREGARGATVILTLSPGEGAPPALLDALGASADALRVAIGAPLEGVDALHLGHPLVQLAVADARAQPSGGVEARCDALPEGTRGALRVVKVRHAGLQPVERLRAFAALESGETLDDAETRALLEGPLASRAVTLDAVFAAERDAALDELMDEAIFFDQREVRDGIDEAFARVEERLERFVEDKVLLLRRGLAGLRADRAEAQRAWDDAATADARTAAERRLKKLDAKIEALQGDLESLEARDDATYRRHRDALHARRFAEPQIEIVLDLDFVVSAPDSDPAGPPWTPPPT